MLCFLCNVERFVQGLAHVCLSLMLRSVYRRRDTGKRIYKTPERYPFTSTQSSYLCHILYKDKVVEKIINIFFLKRNKVFILTSGNCICKMRQTEQVCWFVNMSWNTVVLFCRQLIIHNPNTLCSSKTMFILAVSEPVFNVIWVVFSCTLCSFIHDSWGWGRHTTCPCGHLSNLTCLQTNLPKYHRVFYQRDLNNNDMDSFLLPRNFLSYLYVIICFRTDLGCIAAADDIGLDHSRLT